MRVLLDVTVLGRGHKVEVTRTGIFRSTESLLRAMLLRSDIDLFFGADATWASEILLTAYNQSHGGVLGDRIQRAWRQPGISDADAMALISDVVLAEEAGRDAKKDRAQLTLLSATARRVGFPEPFDVVHSIRTPLGARERIPTRVRALTIHDMIPVLHPEWMFAGAEEEHRAVTDSIGPADFVVTNSRSTAEDVHSLLGIGRERIFVTLLAADSEVFRREEDAGRIAEVRTRHGIPEGPYLLSLCTLEPRKNLLHLLRCFHRLVREGRAPGLSLVLTGPTGWKSDPLFELLQKHADLRSRVVLPGYVPDADLGALFSGARGFVYPSLYEGFGLPVLEAMQCGTPVITTDSSSLPEVAGSAAILVGPDDTDELTDALARVASDDALAQDLAIRGLEQAKRFSWEKTADATVAAYHRMLGAGT